jgi:hypothetical protein
MKRLPLYRGDPDFFGADQARVGHALGRSQHPPSALNDQAQRNQPWMALGQGGAAHGPPGMIGPRDSEAVGAAVQLKGGALDPSDVEPQRIAADAEADEAGVGAGKPEQGFVDERSPYLHFIYP